MKDTIKKDETGNGAVNPGITNFPLIKNYKNYGYIAIALVIVAILIVIIF